MRIAKAMGRLLRGGVERNIISDIRSDSHGGRLLRGGVDRNQPVETVLAEHHRCLLRGGVARNTKWKTRCLHRSLSPLRGGAAANVSLPRPTLLGARHRWADRPVREERDRPFRKREYPRDLKKKSTSSIHRATTN